MFTRRPSLYCGTLDDFGQTGGRPQGHPPHGTPASGGRPLVEITRAESDGGGEQSAQAGHEHLYSKVQRIVAGRAEAGRRQGFPKGIQGNVADPSPGPAVHRCLLLAGQQAQVPGFSAQACWPESLDESRGYGAGQGNDHDRAEPGEEDGGAPDAVGKAQSHREAGHPQSG